jgi:hypothetical protein
MDLLRGAQGGTLANISKGEDTRDTQQAEPFLEKPPPPPAHHHHQQQTFAIM